jgi:hypothetical protein
MTNDELQHYGVKGMRWGVSKGSKSDALGRYRRGASKKTARNIKSDAGIRQSATIAI